jgi:hypothetical protein
MLAGLEGFHVSPSMTSSPTYVHGQRLISLDCYGLGVATGAGCCPGKFTTKWAARTYLQWCSKWCQTRVTCGSQHTHCVGATEQQSS